MFSEINPDFIKNNDGGDTKRWFRDAENNYDLFIWQNRDDKVIRLQVWDEFFFLEWNSEQGLSTGKTDGQNGAFSSYQSPSFRYHDRADGDVARKILQVLHANPDLQELFTDLNEIILEIESLAAEN